MLTIFFCLSVCFYVVVQQLSLSLSLPCKLCATYIQPCDKIDTKDLAVKKETRKSIRTYLRASSCLLIVLSIISFFCSMYSHCHNEQIQTNRQTGKQTDKQIDESKQLDKKEISAVYFNVATFFCWNFLLGWCLMMLVLVRTYEFNRVLPLYCLHHHLHHPVLRHAACQPASLPASKTINLHLTAAKFFSLSLSLSFCF